MDTFHSAETAVIYWAQWLKLGVELIGALIIGLGVLIGMYHFVRTLLTGRPVEFTAVRLVMARYLALGLEFQLGADILSTAIAPGWEEIGKLAAIAIIRTALNFFLSREMRDESATAAGERRTERDVARSAPAHTD